MENIDEIIAARLAKESLSQEEINSLDEWLSQAKSHRQIYSRLETMAQRGKLLQGDHRDHNLVYHEILNKVLQKKRKQQKLIIHSIAASITLLIGLFFLFQQEPEKSVSLHNSFSESIKPGSPKAKLTLEDGKSIDIEVSEESVILADSLVKIENKGNMLVYSSEKMEKVAYNTLSIPLGAEYCVMLPDNTKVFLNSGSELRYPVAFNNNSREVFLQGEAYFEVQKDSTKEFIVHTDQMKIRVLGTSFNVKAYPEQDMIATTLTEGKIQISCDSQLYNIVPGMQLTYHKRNRETNIQEVDTELYTSWKNGYYKFEEMPLEEIMSTLSRWYNLEIFYQSPAKKMIIFTGQLKRYDDVTQLLRKFEETHEVEFLINGKCITVK